MKLSFNKCILALLAFMLLGSSTQARRVEDDNNSRGHLFEWGNYAMFIHWGLFSNIANVWDGKTYYGVGEWLMNKNMAGVDRDEYMAVAKTFNPVHFDAMKIAQLAKDAGMKYIIITSKHHDGFAMYHSQCNKFNIYDATPFHRDPMKELAEACKKLDLGFGFYYSHNQDWTYPGGSGGPRVDKEGNRKTFDDYYHEKCLPQVKEITQNYGPMTLIWFDTPGGMSAKYSKELVDLVHKNQPQAFVSGRVGNDLGDYQTLGDMEVPLKNIDGLWESVDVTNDSWGYAWYDNNWKSPKQILMNLLSTVARGGTYMLNIGPDGMGDVPQMVQQSLRAAGKWIARYPQTVYGATSSPWGHALPWGDVVQQGNKLYLLVYQWPNSGRLYLPGLKTGIQKAALLNGQKRQHLSYNSQANGTELMVPHAQPEQLVNVIELSLSSAEPNVDQTLNVDPELGFADLSVKFGKSEGCTIYHASWMEKFGEWKYMYCTKGLNNGGKVTWQINFPQAGTYDVQVKVRGNARCVWKVETDEGHFVQNQQATSSLFTFRPLGWVQIDHAGTHTLTISMPEGGETVEVASISLKPITF